MGSRAHGNEGEGIARGSISSLSPISPLQQHDPNASPHSLDDDDDSFSLPNEQRWAEDSFLAPETTERSGGGGGGEGKVGDTGGRGSNVGGACSRMR
jgi:hypothetical protein